jgi:hypothetical protein
MPCLPLDTFPGRDDEIFQTKPAKAPSRRGVIHHALLVRHAALMPDLSLLARPPRCSHACFIMPCLPIGPLTGRDEEIFPKKPAKAPSRRGVIHHALLVRHAALMPDLSLLARPPRRSHA